MSSLAELEEEIKNIPIAKVEEVEQFVKETGVDTIAAAVGTAHGVYDNEDILMDLTFILVSIILALTRWPSG